MKNFYKKKLEKLILTSSLLKEEKLLWRLFLKISSPAEDEAVFEAANEEKQNLSILTKYLADKIFDMGKDNKKAWAVLSKDEIKFTKFMQQLC